MLAALAGKRSTGTDMKWMAWWRARVSATLMRCSPAPPLVNANTAGWSASV